MPPQKIRVGVIYGGRSGEHEVSLVSARSVMDALDPERYDIVPIRITRMGYWITGPDALHVSDAAQDESRSTAVISPDATVQGLTPIDTARVAAGHLDVVFPLIHGTYGEDGTLQGLLEMADLAYVGSGVLGSAVAMDKVVQKQLCQYAQLPVVDYAAMTAQEFQTDPHIAQQKVSQFTYPLFIKPANLGSSVGISKVHSTDELERACTTAFSYDEKVIAEIAVPHAMEIEVAVLGNDNPQASVPGQIISSNEFYDYDAKYVDGMSTDKIPAPLPQAMLEQIQRYAVQGFTVCNCSGMARVDFLVNEQTHDIYLNEINTIPGFTSISMYPKLWKASGLEYPALLDRLIGLAIARHQGRTARRTDYTPKKNWYQ